MTDTINLKATWSHDPLGASDATSLAYLLLDITQPDAPAQPAGGQGRSADAALNLSLVLDTSGSMAGAKLDNLKKAVAWVIDHLSARDTVAITLFDDEVRPLVGSTGLDNKADLIAQVDAISEAGGTAMSKGLRLGLDEARKASGPGVVSRIIVLTDGQTWGDADQCIELAAAAGAAGIPIDAFGLGADEDWSIELLDGMAGESGGSVEYIAGPEQISAAFEGALRQMQATTARDLQLTFNPAGGVSARAIYRVAPMISRLWPSMDSAADNASAQGHAEVQTGESEAGTQLTLPLGDIQSADGQTLLVEVVLPPRRPGSYRLARILLKYEVGSIAEDTALDLVTSFAAGAGTGPGNPRVMNSVEKATTFKLQTRALQASMLGDTETAGKNLRAAATRLLSMGETELAGATTLEAERIEAEGRASAGATKKLTFDTRRLSAAETVRLKE
ncbi:MAG TPA: VWA domain-containing protein [Chloroflexia bacterium]|nr:VWA domain-containing protein [Chloroflexia bacterium]